MTSRHHYSIPGASFLRPRSSSKTQPQKTATPSTNVPSSSRDTRQPSSSRTYHTQEAVAGNQPPRPPSASGYRTQHPNASVTGFHASSNARQTPAQRSATTPPASSSRTRLDVPDTRGYLAKMFGRKQNPAPTQGDERQRSSQKQPRASQAQQAVHNPAAPIQAPSFAGPSTSRTAYDASLQARDSDREERARRKAKDENTRAERTKEERERLRAEYAAHKARQEEAERAQAAAPKLPRTERTASRPSREERRQQDYESDNAKRRLQTQQMGQTPGQKQEARQSYYLHATQTPIPPSRATALMRDSQQPSTPQATAHPPGVPVQPSNSSQSTSASHQAHALHPTHPLTRIESSSPNPNQTAAPVQESAPAPPPKPTFAPYPTPNHAVLPQTAQATPPMLPPYPPVGPDGRHRYDRDTAERDALLAREREQAKRREAAEKEAGRERERERERELERRREAEKEAANRELQVHREREAEREAERERRRAKRAEREKRKELENAERERQKQAERAERERLKALEQMEYEKQREAERLRRERKEQERAERQRMKVELERQEAERLERERLRVKAEKERASKSASKHRSHRDKSQSLPTNTLIGAASGSDTERMTSKKDGRRRSHSQSAVIDPQTVAALSNAHRPESRREHMHLTNSTAAFTSAVKRDVQYLEQPPHEPIQVFPKSSTPLPVQSLHADIANPRSASAVPLSSHEQDLTPPKVPERSRAELPGTRGSMESAPTWNKPSFEVVQPKLVSIYASQGPSDRTGYRVMQKTSSGQPSPDQRLPTTISAVLPAVIIQEGQPRSSLDQPSRRTSLSQPVIAPSMGPATTTSLGQTQPSRESPIPAQEPRSIGGNNLPPFSAPPRAPQLEKSLPTPTPNGMISPNPDILHASSAQNARQHAIPMAKQQPIDDRFESIKPPASTPHGAGFSSYSQHVFGAPAEQMRTTSQDQQFPPMSRAPSNNSTRSPSRKAGHLPAEAPGGVASAVPVSRTASDASRTTETWEREQFIAPHNQSHAHSGPSHGQQRSGQPNPPPKPPLSSRVKHESLTNFHAQSAPHTHSHSQSLPQQMPLPYRNNSSRDEIDISDHDNLPNARARPHIPGAASLQQYPSVQVPQSKPAYNPSINASIPVHPQQTHPAISSAQEHRPPSRSQANAINVSSYSAATASQDAISQMPSNMLSHHQFAHQSNNPLYHNHSTARNIPAHQPQHSQQPQTSARPQQSNPQTSNGAAKIAVSSRPANSAVYVTYRSGPIVEDSPSSSGGGISLDSPPPNKPLPQFPNERPARQPTSNRPQSQIGPLTPVGQNSYSPAENQKTPRPQDSPPPLTPSSSRESHEEILMTPASLDQTRGQVDVHTPTDSTHRSEKKKGGLLRLFRSSSTKSNKEKEIRDRLEPKEQDARNKQVPGPGLQRDQQAQAESLNKPRSVRPPTIVLTAAEPESNPIPPNTGSMPMTKQTSRASRHVPPPISIPAPEAIPFRLFSSKSRRYRTMSAASMEAVDGTANNTVVGSPTSSRRSPTPSGPLTPSVRDPIEAAQAWRDNEEVFLDPGSQRRRRPGVTFDLKGDEGQKDGAVYRRVSRIQRHRRESPR